MTKITTLLGIKYPVIQGAMQTVATANLAAAVSNGGGLGVIAAGGLSASELRAQIRQAKQLTSHPFAVNLMLMATNTSELVQVIIAEQVPVVTTGAGTPKAYLPTLKAAGIKVIPVVPNVTIAKKMAALGVDAVIAEGMEGGGHIGELTSQVLWPQIADAIDIPLIAAGGIADGRGVVSALALGAAGVQCGTIFSIAQESPVGDRWRQAVIKATDTATVVVGRSIRDASRALKNQQTEQLQALETQTTDRIVFNQALNQGLKLAVTTDDVTNGVIFSGQVAGLINEALPAATIVQRLMADAQTVLQQLPTSLEAL
ncbi:nitronate monooxygenase [Lactiplantibacillus sp. WILCCON 0030]|uniref:Probable nitronate monooxygenase n=1 Tax=Lactiplantibacillus brownii TaxID=3069269 RepID=A0ABU1ABF3_9LACO|nr:nitronate monooxygenase [Lactiplantibacillus brownii]MDQ7938297.1 nitronate monooxygenase [Lactiplantibacillus brownii]